jgi:hypothetical protein
LFFSYKKNPTKELFTQELIREYAVKHGIDNSSSNMLSEFANSLFGGLVEPMVKRNDYIIFSSYELELNNELIRDSIYAIGFWDNIFLFKKLNGNLININDPSNNKEVIKEPEIIEENFAAADTVAYPITKKVTFENNSSKTAFLSYAFYDGSCQSIGWFEILPNKSKVISLPVSYTGSTIYWYVYASNDVKWEGNDAYFCVSHPDAFHYYTNEKCNEQAGFHKLDLTGEYTSQGLGE